MGDSVATGFGLNQDTVWSNELKTRPTGERYYFKRPLGDSVAVPKSIRYRCQQSQLCTLYL